MGKRTRPKLSTQKEVESMLDTRTRSRFWKYVKKLADDECWEWQAARTPDKGYGRFGLGSFVFRAHRVSWMLHKGPIPEGLQVCHECDNASCVNPQHLYLGTNADNHRDKARRERVGGPYGKVKLTAALVTEIRSSSLTNVAWAKRLDVHPTTIHMARVGKKWKHVPMPDGTFPV